MKSPVVTWLIGDARDFSLRHRLFNLIALIGIVMAVSGSLMSYWLRLGSGVVAVTLLMGAVTVGLYCLSRRRKRYTIPASIAVITLSFVFLPVMWIINGGSLGGIPYYLVINAGIVSILMVGPGRGMVLGLFFLVVAGLVGLEFWRPDYITFIASHPARYIDLAVSLFTCLGANALLFTVLIEHYHQERQKAEQYAIQLEEKNREIEQNNNFLELINEKLLKETNNKDHVNKLLQIEKQKLQKQSMTDGLTGVFNRSFITSQLQAAVEAAGAPGAAGGLGAVGALGAGAGAGAGVGETPGSEDGTGSAGVVGAVGVKGAAEADRAQGSEEPLRAAEAKGAARAKGSEGPRGAGEAKGSEGSLQTSGAKQMAGSTDEAGSAGAGSLGASGAAVTPGAARAHGRQGSMGAEGSEGPAESKDSGGPPEATGAKGTAEAKGSEGPPEAAGAKGLGGPEQAAGSGAAKEAEDEGGAGGARDEVGAHDAGSVGGEGGTGNKGITGNMVSTANMRNAKSAVNTRNMGNTGNSAGGRGVPMVAAMLDIDNFKDINDTYGHVFGDYVLKMVSRTIEANLRQRDLVGRYGGEEFLVLLPATRLADGTKIIERVRQEIMALDWDQKELRVTISGGVTEIGDKNPNQVLKQADQLMYLAKRQGKNRIEAERK